MIKYIAVLLCSILVIGPHAYAEEKDESANQQDNDHPMHHEEHETKADETHNGHSEHSGHNMEHAPDNDTDHSDHDMDHSDHNAEHDADKKMDHSKMDHSNHDMTGNSHDEHTGHQMGSGDGHSAHDHSGHHMEDGHIMDMDGGMVMGQNLDKLPSSCSSISEEIEITVYAGRKYTEDFPGTAFAFDKQQWNVKPCAKITWHLVNDDGVRHQFMMHGLPKYLYKNGMFHLEVTGPRKISGTMIVPATDATYLVHCDISQHMEKGMKGQLVVGKGGDDLPSIPGLTPYTFTDTYTSENLPQVSDQNEEDSIVKQMTDFFTTNTPVSGIMIIGLLVGIFGALLITKFVAPSLRLAKDIEE